mmetsp:Transcript_9225/g.27784  ORF Transcript_9225/g.27784 Transcript_9225/m.27784 type:complete len:147 (+) Transcript_9225:158-598(+)|eukprot:CAMPEP_0198727526 /NCGR_PEP_ID=MMETSP1475-20131203/4387_1 /TAXON_ID= ORGANISM="Unidentified sp., Strain CCMP1999" /NCGR_SAMPLE_ID=MMETSP1475 /ASSEMBLY_ACC=CAM_ASM_001111 /LENGTH=146 /DNA_ID=CAMNT_0044489577 /DNA_START=139 /DNA_END=579 /DNA_ORIENTATION=+
MSDEEVMDTAEEVPKPEEMTLMTAVQEVLRKALVSDQLARGAREAAKALDRGDAKLCLLAEDCDEESYTRLIEALCQNQKVHLIRVPEKVKLGEWAGQCKIDPDGNARKVRACTCVVIKDFGERSAGLDFLQQHIQSGDTGEGGDE